MVRTNLWTKDGIKFTREGSNHREGKKCYGHITAATLEALGYKNKVIEYIEAGTIDNYTDSFQEYPDGKTYWVHYEEEEVILDPDE